ncbi:hypothetical protein GGR52DRAFT_574437 [Hypoxylon sp. FL1284]|nr:hypothetical protein GGR52DRAFT_574437 [Hypoxylon sp. FL1284]
MRYTLALLALSFTAMAAPLSRIPELEKRVPDVDQELADAGYLPVKTTSKWAIGIADALIGGDRRREFTDENA